MDDCYLNGVECLTQTTNQRVCLRKDAMGALNAVSRLINALAPINRLPPEILGMVQMCGDRSPKDLVAVSGVCSYWRNTFIATPSLWTTLDGKGLEKSRAWVERSGALPIQLLARGSPNPEVLEFLAPHYHRLGMVHLPQLVVHEEGAVSILPLPSFFVRAPSYATSVLPFTDLRASTYPCPLPENSPPWRVCAFPGSQCRSPTSVLRISATSDLVVYSTS